MRRRARRLAAIILVVVLAASGFRALVRARTFQVFGVLVDRVDTREPVVALTFDDGPNTATIDGILQVLAESNVRATFFVVGNELERHPEAGRRLVAAGHELGNHSYSHQRMILTSPAAAQVEIERTDALIRAAGQGNPILFRPPYCVKFVGLPWYLWRSGRTSVTWDIEPESFAQVASNPASIVQHVMERVRPGSVILLHPWYRSGEPTREAVPQIIRSIHKRGFRFVTVTEMLRVRHQS